MINSIQENILAVVPSLVFFGALMIFLACFGLLKSRIAKFVDGLVALYETKFVDELQFKSSGTVVVWSWLCAICLGIVALPFLISPIAAIFWILVIFLVVRFGPKYVYEIMHRMRRKKIDAILPNLLQQLAANFKTTRDISKALFEVAETAPAPMDHELRLIRQKENDLQSFPEALDQAGTRIGSDWFNVVAGVLKTTYEHGGKESDALMNLSRVFVQLRTMQERIDTATSQGRMSMRIIMAAPIVVIVVALWLVPEIAMEAWDSLVGKLMLGLAAFMYILGILSSIWLSSVKI